MSNCSPVDSGGVKSSKTDGTPSTTVQYRRSSSSASGLSPAVSMGALAGRPIDIAQVLEDNRKLKAEVFDIKTELYAYRQGSALLKDKDGVDITREYVECVMKVEKYEEQVAENAKTIRELTEQQKEMEKAFLEDKKMLEREVKDLTSERDYLVGQLNKNPPTVLNVSLSREDGNISQEESSASEMSILSQRDVKISTMESRLLFLEQNEENLKKRHEEEMTKLREELETYKKATESGDVEVVQQNYEVQLEAMLADKAELVEMYESRIAALKAEHDENMANRDRMVNVLVRKLKTMNASLIVEPLADDSETGSPKAGETVTRPSNSNTYLKSAVLQGVAKSLNSDRSVKAEIVSGEEGDAQLMDSADREVAEKMQRYDDDNWMPSQLCDSARAMATEEVEVFARRVSQVRLSNVFKGSDRSFGQLDVTNVQGKLEVCRSTVKKLVHRLRGSADVLQMILKQLGAEQMGKKLYEQIMDLNGDFDTSLTAAAALVHSLDDIERSVWEFSSVMEQSLSVANRSAAPPGLVMECIAEKDDELAKLSEKYEQVIAELSTTIGRMRELEARDVETQKELTTLKEILAKKEEELKHFHATEVNLQKLNEEREKHVRELGEQLKESEQRNEQMLVDMKTQRGQLDALNRELCDEREQLKTQLSDKDRVLKEIFSNLDEAKLEAVNKEKLLEHYDKEQKEVNLKARSLIAAVRKSLLSIEGTVHAFGDSQRLSLDANEFGDGNTPAQKMHGYVDELGDGIGQLRTLLKTSEEGRRQAEKNCNSIQIELERAQKEAVSYRSKLADIEERVLSREVKETQTAMQMTSIRVLEAEHDRLTTVEKLYEENLGRMQAKLEEEVEERDRLKVDIEKLRSHAAASKAPPSLNQLNKEMMTSLSSTELRNNEELLAAYVNFARHVNERVLACSKKNIPRKDRFTCDQLKELEGRLTRILNLYENQLFELKKQLESTKIDTEKVASASAAASSVVSTEPLKTASSVTSTSSKTVTGSTKQSGLSAKELLNRVAEQVTATEGAEVFEEAKAIVKMLKTIGSTKEEERSAVEKKILDKARDLRTKLASFCNRIEFFENAKENMDPDATNENLRNENARLRLALDDAKKTLAKMHERFREMPSTDAICEVIVKELKNISDAIKEASTNYKTMRPHRGNAK